jgi:hypothetical protein
MELSDQIKNTLEDFTSLKYHEKENAFWGELIIGGSDSYEIIIYLGDFPNDFPIVIEVGERIPKKVERHVYTNGNCCFTTKAKKEIFLKSEIFTISQFIEKVAVPYFQNNSFYEINGHYKYGGHSHDQELSTHETYEDILGIRSIYVMRSIISDRLKPLFRIRGNDNCYCKSGNKLKNCKNHYKNYLDFIKIEKETLKSDLGHLEKLIIEVEKLKEKEINPK